MIHVMYIMKTNHRHKKNHFTKYLIYHDNIPINMTF